MSTQPGQDRESREIKIHLLRQTCYNVRYTHNQYQIFNVKTGVVAYTEPYNPDTDRRGYLDD